MQRPEEAAYEIDGEIVTETQLSERKATQLNALYTNFAGMRDRWVQHRSQSGVEVRWRKATALFFGDQDENYTSDLTKTLTDGPKVKKAGDQPRSQVVINIVRPKVEQVQARLCEILFPVDDRNWGIRPTPKPEIAGMVGVQTPTVNPQTGQSTGLTADQEAQAVMQAAKEAAEGMQKSIDDDLTQCQFNGECRKIIEDGVRLGTGILKGPFPSRTKKKVWAVTNGKQALTVDVKTAPTSARVDPWDIFFDPACGNDHQRGRGVFHRRNVTRKELRDLVGIKGYDTSVIKQILLEQPKRVRMAEGRILREIIQDDSYELWEYHGDVEPQDVEAVTGNIGDPVTGVEFAVVAMINDRIISAMKSWVDDRTLPYDVWCYRKSDSMPQGYGIPDEMVHQQSVINSAWRQLMDNARVSMGGQIVIRKGITPQDGKWVLEPNKIWIASDSLPDVRQAFDTHEFESHLVELLQVCNAAMQFSDTETGVPQLMGGEQGSAPETVGGMIMMYNNANAVLRQRVKLYDDNITRPHIGRYYDFKMANDPDPNIKGDFNIDARGSSALLERDIQNQAMVNLANITSNPRYAPHCKEREELKAILKSFRMNPEDIMKTEEQVRKDIAANPPAQDPRMVAAQATLQAKQLDIQDRQAERDFENQRNATDDAFRRQQLEYNRQREQAEFVIAQTDSSIKRDGLLLRENNALTINREANQAKERLGILNIENDRQIFNAEAALKARMGSGI